MLPLEDEHRGGGVHAGAAEPGGPLHRLQRNAAVQVADQLPVVQAPGGGDRVRQHLADRVRLGGVRVDIRAGAAVPGDIGPDEPIAGLTEKRLGSFSANRRGPRPRPRERVAVTGGHLGSGGGQQRGERPQHEADLARADELGVVGGDTAAAAAAAAAGGQCRRREGGGGYRTEPGCREVSSGSSFREVTWPGKGPAAGAGGEAAGYGRCMTVPAGSGGLTVLPAPGSRQVARDRRRCPRSRWPAPARRTARPARSARRSRSRHTRGR